MDNVFCRHIVLYYEKQSQSEVRERVFFFCQWLIHSYRSNIRFLQSSATDIATGSKFCCPANVSGVKVRFAIIWSAWDCGVKASIAANTVCRSCCEFCSTYKWGRCIGSITKWAIVEWFLIVPDCQWIFNSRNSAANTGDCNPSNFAGTIIGTNPRCM